VPRQATPLTDVRIRSRKPASKETRLYDANGLYLSIAPSGARWWRLKYYFAGRERRTGLGSYPEVTIAEARQRRDDVRRLIRDGIDPLDQKREIIEAKQRERRAIFPVVAAEWLEMGKEKRWAPVTYQKAKYVTETYLIPALRRQSVTTIQSKAAREALAKISAPAIAIKARQHLRSIVDFARAEGLRDDGKPLHLGDLIAKHQKGHVSSATKAGDLAPVVRAIDAHASPVVRAALIVCMLTAQRPMNVASAIWDEIDLDAAVWRIPADKMKMRREHRVPLSRQAVEAFRSMLPYTAGKAYVFPPLARQRSQHINRDTLSLALRDMGFQGKHAPHGFRAAFRTLGREVLNADVDVLEAHLAHEKKGDVQRAYDHATFQLKRIEVMQRWADFIDKLKSDPDNLVQLRKETA
jgi:integrase